MDGMMLIDQASREQRILLTEDKDFVADWPLSAMRTLPASSCFVFPAMLAGH